jgi:hypothetical protein
MIHGLAVQFTRLAAQPYIDPEHRYNAANRRDNDKPAPEFAYKISHYYSPRNLVFAIIAIATVIFPKRDIRSIIK